MPEPLGDPTTELCLRCFGLHIDMFFYRHATDTAFDAMNGRNVAEQAMQPTTLNFVLGLHALVAAA